MTAVLLLENEQGESVETAVNLKKSSKENSQVYFDTRAKLTIKEEKTKVACDEALKRAKKCAVKEIETKKLATKKKLIGISRKRFWFDKFYWFLSSENYLVISANDAQQNEILVKRYLKKNDIIFHAHIHGAAFTVVKNPREGPVPTMTIMEASMATLAHSKAWGLKVVHDVFWVNADQISKTAPTGGYLSTGSFMVYGKKNFVHPKKLEMGYALVFSVSLENIAKHSEERRVLDGNDKRVKDALKIQSLHIDYLRNQEQETEVKEDNNKGVFNKLVSKNTEVNGEEIFIETKAKPVRNQAPKPKEPKVEQSSKSVIVVDSGTKVVKKVSKLQKKKMEKYIDRYGDEDEDERKFRMAAQGYRNNSAFEESSKKFEWNRHADQHEATLVQFIDDEQGPKENIEGGEIDLMDRGLQEKNQKHLTKKTKVEVEEELEDENVDYGFSNLTGMPFEDDVVTGVYPVCAPFSTIENYKYKVKLIPGTMKRGKIMQVANQMFVAQTGATLVR